MPFDLNGKGREGKAGRARQGGQGREGKTRRITLGGFKKGEEGKNCWKDTRQIKEKVNEG